MLPTQVTHPAVLYSLGYRASPHARDIVARLASIGAVIVDIRSDPDAQLAGWCRSDLQGWLNGPSFYGEHYLYLPGLRNVGGLDARPGVQLDDPDGGIAILARYLKNGQKVCLLCSDGNGDDPHRKGVALLVQQVLSGKLLILHL